MMVLDTNVLICSSSSHSSLGMMIGRSTIFRRRLFSLRSNAMVTYPCCLHFSASSITSWVSPDSDTMIPTLSSNSDSSPRLSV